MPFPSHSLWLGSERRTGLASRSVGAVPSRQTGPENLRIPNAHTRAICKSGTLAAESVSNEWAWAGCWKWHSTYLRPPPPPPRPSPNLEAEMHRTRTFTTTLTPRRVVSYHSREGGPDRGPGGRPGARDQRPADVHVARGDAEIGASVDHCDAHCALLNAFLEDRALVVSCGE